MCPPSFGLAPAAPLQVHAPLAPNQSVEISLPLNTVGSVMKMDPLNNLQVRASTLAWGAHSGTQVPPLCADIPVPFLPSQVAVKNNIDVFYFSTLYPLHILFVEDGKMGELERGCHPIP